MRRIFIHVGAPKTGTTFLQDTVAATRDAITSAGLLYPDTPSGSHFEAAIDLLDMHWGGALDGARGSWDALASVARSARTDVLISHEILASATAQQVHRAVESLRCDAELHLIYTARDIGRQIPAEWQETVKHRRGVFFSRYVARLRAAPRFDSDEWFWRVQHLPDVIGRWSSGIPMERVHVITVPQPGGGDLWDRFAGLLGFGHVSVTPSAHTNTSMGIPETAMLRRLNVRLKGRGISQQVYGTTVRHLLVHGTLAQRDRKQRIELSPHDQPFAEQIAQEWIDWIGSHPVELIGDADELRPRWSDKDWVDPDKPDNAEILDAALDALVALVVEAEQRNSSTRVEHPIAAAAKKLTRWIRR